MPRDLDRACDSFIRNNNSQCLNCRGGGGVGGWTPQLFAQPPPPNKMPWDTLGGQFQPPAVVNDAELPVCNDNDNE
jgi:hypothetical protein